MGDLNEAHTALGEAPRHQALTAEVRRDGIVEAVKPPGCVRLTRDVLRFGHGALHTEGELEGIDPAFEGGVRPSLSEMIAIHRGEQVELLALLLERET